MNCLVISEKNTKGNQNLGVFTKFFEFFDRENYWHLFAFKIITSVNKKKRTFEIMNLNFLLSLGPA